MCSTSLNENLDTGIPCTECVDRISGSSNSITYTLSSNTDCEYCQKVCEEDTESQTLGRENDQSPSKYLDQSIFTLLIPTLEETLIEASKWNALRVWGIFTIFINIVLNSNVEQLEYQNVIE